MFTGHGCDRTRVWGGRFAVCSEGAESPCVARYPSATVPNQVGMLRGPTKTEVRAHPSRCGSMSTEGCEAAGGLTARGSSSKGRRARVVERRWYRVNGARVVTPREAKACQPRGST